jgi:hypothetical protein
MIKSPDSLDLHGTDWIIEKIKFQMTGPVMLNGLEIDPNLINGIKMPDRYLLHPINELLSQNRPRDKEKTLTSPFITVLPVG